MIVELKFSDRPPVLITEVVALKTKAIPRPDRVLHPRPGIEVEYLAGASTKKLEHFLDDPYLSSIEAFGCSAGTRYSLARFSPTGTYRTWELEEWERYLDSGKCPDGFWAVRT